MFTWPPDWFTQIDLNAWYDFLEMIAKNFM